MDNTIPVFVFRNRRFVSITTFIVPTVLKFCLDGTTSLLLFGLGSIIVVAGMAFRMYSAGYLWGKHIVTKIESDFLCTSGPFAYIRNPLYLGNFVIGLGFCISLNEWYAYAIFIIAYTCLYSIVIPHERKFLQEKFGNAYLEYRARTGRFLPRLKSYQGGKKPHPDRKLGVASEIYHLIILVIAFITIFLLFVR